MNGEAENHDWEIKKLQELYEFSKHVYYIEHERFFRMEEKANRFVTALILLMAVLGLLVNAQIDINPLRHSSFITRLNALFIGGFVITLSLALYFLLVRVLNIYGRPRPELETDFIEDIKNKDQYSFYNGLIEHMQQKWKEMKETNDKKSSFLKKSHFFSSISLLFLVISCALFVII